MEKRKSNKHLKVDKRDDVIAMYQTLEQFLKSEEFEEDLKKVLQKSNPNYPDILVKRRRDIERSDHGIVIAGETSSGKSTLVNRISGKRILTSRNLESTSTVCKLRNSERIKVIVEHKSGKIEEVDLTDKCDINTKEGEKILRNTLKNLTDVASSEESRQHRSVEIGLPIPFLKGNIMLVDTPGIGGSEDATQKIMEYLPNALSFVFVINVANAGGMQGDRLPSILRTLICLKMEDEMPCFDPKDVIFITNKWDAIHQEESDSEEEDEEARTWKKTLSDIKSRWKEVNEKNIFRMSLKEVLPGNKNRSVEQFEEFQKALMPCIEKAKHARVIEHLRFLQELLENATKNVNARLQLDQQSEESQIELTKTHQKELQDLKEECRKMREDLQTRVMEHISAKSEEAYKYMSTDSGKRKILNPDGCKPILDMWNTPDECANEVRCRVSRYLESFLKSEKVMVEFEKIQRDIESFLKEVSLKLGGMEDKWRYKVNNDGTSSAGEVLLVALSELGISFALRALAYASFAYFAVGGLIISLAAVTLSLAVSQMYKWFTNKLEKNRQAVDEEYDNCRSSVRKIVSDQLKENIGVMLTKMIDKVTVDILPRRIEALEETIQQLLKSRKEIIAKREMLKNLASKLDGMQRNICRMQIDLETQIPREKDKSREGST